MTLTNIHLALWARRFSCGATIRSTTRCSGRDTRCISSALRYRIDAPVDSGVFDLAAYYARILLGDIDGE